MNSCSKCWKDLDPCIDIILNGKHICPNCLVGYIVFHEDELWDVNILKDNDYKYTLSKNLLIRLIKYKLTKKQYKELKEKYPNSFYLHDDFYDEDGNSLQPTD